jgi:hypothetical protein
MRGSVVGELAVEHQIEWIRGHRTWAMDDRTDGGDQRRGLLVRRPSAGCPQLPFDDLLQHPTIQGTLEPFADACAHDAGQGRHDDARGCLKTRRCVRPVSISRGNLRLRKLQNEGCLSRRHRQSRRRTFAPPTRPVGFDAFHTSSVHPGAQKSQAPQSGRSAAASSGIRRRGSAKVDGLSNGCHVTRLERIPPGLVR